MVHTHPGEGEFICLIAAPAGLSQCPVRALTRMRMFFFFSARIWFGVRVVNSHRILTSVLVARFQKAVFCSSLASSPHSQAEWGEGRCRQAYCRPCRLLDITRATCNSRSSAESVLGKVNNLQNLTQVLSQDQAVGDDSFKRFRFRLANLLFV